MCVCVCVCVCVCARARAEYHSAGGPLKVTVTSSCPLTESLRQAGLELGYPLVDPNGETMIGKREWHSYVCI